MQLRVPRGARGGPAALGLDVERAVDEGEEGGALMRLASENISGFRRRTRAPPPMPMPRASNEVTLPAIGVGRRVAPP